MRYSDKDCIVIGFDDDMVHLTSVILMNGRSGLKKKIQGIRGKNKMTIYHVNFGNKTCIDVGHISLPQDVPAVDIIIEFKPEEDGGTVTICNIDQVWNYSVMENPQMDEKESENPTGSLIQVREIPSDKSKCIVDKEKVRELEKKKRQKPSGRMNWLRN